MTSKQPVLILVALCGLSALRSTAFAFEENGKFCIRTEPVLLSELRPNGSIDEVDSRCEITATTLTTKEKESFAKTMCNDLHSSSHKKDYFYFKLHNGELAGRDSYQTICGGQTNPLLAWIPYSQIRKNFATELNPKEHLVLIGKAYDSTRERTELCHFQHFDLANKISDSLFSCVLMIFEDNFFSVRDNINVLVEIQPIMYEVRNISYLPWVNVTTSYKTLLGKTTLKNLNREKKQIFGSINYAYVEKVNLNGSSVYQQSEAKLPLLFEHKGSVIELDSNGIGGLDIKEKAYFGRTMDPKSNVNVDVIGQWAEHKKQFNAELYEYFGFGIRRFYKDMHHGEVSFVRIESTEPVYEMIESSNLAKATLHNPNAHPDPDSKKSFERLTEEKISKASAGEWSSDAATDGPVSDELYPNFYPWFIAACIIVGATIIIALIAFIRTCGSGEDPQRYQLAPKI